MAGNGLKMCRIASRHTGGYSRSKTSVNQQSKFNIIHPLETQYSFKYSSACTNHVTK
jgi:hypothetical protein